MCVSHAVRSVTRAEGATPEWGWGRMRRVSPNTWRWQHRDEVAPVWPGHHQVLGATWSPTATNFAIRSPESTACWVCLFDEDGTETRHRLTERTLGVWHGQLPDVPVGQLYGFRVDGPWDPEHGRRFNPAKLLLDPYARAIAGEVTPGPATLGYAAEHPLNRSRSTPRAMCRDQWSCTTSSTGRATATCSPAGATP